MDINFSYRITKWFNMFNGEIVKITKMTIPNIVYEHRDL